MGIAKLVLFPVSGEQELAGLGGFRLTPGMPVGALIQTGERTVLSYLRIPDRPDRPRLPRLLRGREQGTQFEPHAQSPLRSQ